MSGENSIKNKSENVKLDDLFLDPNNYRFIDDKNYKSVAEKDLMNDSIQKRTMNFILGKNQREVDDLLRSFVANGFLPIDQIQVRELTEKGKFLVLEGNRRIATLKFLKEKYNKESFEIGNLSPDVFKNKKVPVIISSGLEELEYLKLMGLKHISGNKKWNAVNQAQLLKDMIAKGTEENDLKDALALTTTQLRRYLRTLGLVEQYKKSDYGDQFVTEMFNIFAEIIKKPELKDWLNWNDQTYESQNTKNSERLFSWLSEEEEENEEGETMKLKKIIERGDDIRILGKIIGDEKMLQQMEQLRSIAEVYEESDIILEDKFKTSLNLLDKQLQNVATLRKYATDQDFQHLLEQKRQIEELLRIKNKDITKNKVIEREILNSLGTQHFSSITINSYKSLQDITIPNLQKINVFAGTNNSGKTTLLEVIYNLVQMNDLYSFMDLQKRRGKFIDNVPSDWYNKFLPNMSAKAIFRNTDIAINIHKSAEEDENFDKNSYLSTVDIDTVFDKTSLTSRFRLFEDGETQAFFKKFQTLCRIRFSSPFSVHNQDDLFASHQESVETKHFSKIINFIRENIDKDIENIELVSNNGLQRFLVSHKKFPNAVDLTQFGDGLQRIFHISLLFAAARNGILMIDELENAIHHSLLEKFIHFIKQATEEFGIQLFITSHSKECIDMFFENEEASANISAYRLEQVEGKIVCKYSEGKRFSRLIHSFNTDLRS